MTLTPPMQDVQGPDMITMVHKMTMGLRSTRKSRMEANMFVGRMKVHLFVGIVDGQVYFETTKEVSASQYCATFGLVILSSRVCKSFGASITMMVACSIPPVEVQFHLDPGMHPDTMLSLWAQAWSRMRHRCCGCIFINNIYIYICV